MKIKVNRNILWTKIFIEQLASLGIKYACISPGLRSTPLTFTLSKIKKIKSFIHIDERSSAFFALGLAKATGKPVIVVTTSGTAVAELYPAIIEAYQQRVPLIVCTADRPPELIGTGANQTINQHNIFKNHIRWFRDLGLPSVSETGFRYLQKLAIKAYQISTVEDRGPVHFNFPFRKPLEPFSYTDEVNRSISKINPQRVLKNKLRIPAQLPKSSWKIINDVIEYDKGIIIVGPTNYNRELIRGIKKLSTILKYPVFADGLSHLRFRSIEKAKNILINFNAIFQSENFVSNHDPQIVLQFGSTPTSTIIENFLSETNADRYLINSYGDKFDPTRNAKAIVTMEPTIFCKRLLDELNTIKLRRSNSKWIKDFSKAEEITDGIKSRIFERTKQLSEASIITEIFNCIPSGTNIFIGNSLPVRDLDNFLGRTKKKFTIHFNRGASGIDGITSTALGIASTKGKVVLITGDLSFIHDLNALTIANKYSIPITIVVINNNGGGIFESLLIAQKINHFQEYFVTPHDLNLSEIIKSFGIDYQFISQKRMLQLQILKSLKKNSTSVIEIRTNAVISADIRKKYFNEVKKKLNKEFLR